MTDAPGAVHDALDALECSNLLVEWKIDDNSTGEWLVRSLDFRSLGPTYVQDTPGDFLIPRRRCLPSHPPTGTSCANGDVQPNFPATRTSAGRPLGGIAPRRAPK